MNKITNRPWLDLRSVIVAATSVVVIYMASVVFDRPIEWIFALWLSSLVAVVWMAIRIIQDPFTTDKTFDEYFYQDRDDIRRNRIE